MASSDTDDDDLKKAIALSLASQQTKESVTADTATMTAPEAQAYVPKPSASTATATSASAGLDRRAMEQERLARLAGRKRERSISPPPLRSSKKAPKLEETTTTLPSGARLNTFSSLVQQDQTSRKSSTANEAKSRLRAQSAHTRAEADLTNTAKLEPSAAASSGLMYPYGVVKKTWAFGHERTGNEIKLEEVLEARTLRTAVLSAFQWDTEWVLSKLKTLLNGGDTKCVFVMQAKEASMRQQMMKETEDMRSFLRLCFPPMEGQVHCMHSKLMLLFHPEKLRVAIPSANLVNFDWGETGVMENSVFIIDLPRMPERGKTKYEDITCFGKELMHFLEKQGLDRDVRDGVLNFDFAATTHMAFVHTVGGISWRDDAERTGFLGLSSAVRQLGLRTDDVEIDFAASSIGSLNNDQLHNIHSAARGENIIARSTATVAKPKADFFKQLATGPATKLVSVRDKVRIYFPTHETVTASIAGAAGSICISRKYYENMPFPRSCFRDYVSVRSGLLSHNKILYARGKRREGLALKDVAWVYVGSANMSESAWGKLVYDKKEKAWKLNCRNWECGVLLPVPSDQLAQVEPADGSLVNKHQVPGDDSETKSEEGIPSAADEPASRGPVGMDVFKGLVDLPFEYPAQSFGDREPWYFKE